MNHVSRAGLAALASLFAAGCAPQQRGAVTSRAPAIVRGVFLDDYGQRYTIGDSVWQHGQAARYHVVRWDATGKFAIAQNDPANPGDGNACVPFPDKSRLTEVQMKATWNGATLAESDDAVVVEGNHYFPPAALNAEFFGESDHTSVCPWKGTAKYRHVIVDGLRNENAAWFYPAPSDAAREIRDRVAFWKGVVVAP